MRSLVVVVVPALALATSISALVGCGQNAGARSIEGKAERGTTAVLAIDVAGNTFKAVPDNALRFHIDVDSLAPVRLVALKSGVVQTVVFAAKKSSPLRTATEIPNNGGTITLGALSTCDCSGTGDPETTPSTNPLTQCDSNDNGVDDYDDDGHDDAGEGEGEGDCDSHDGSDDGDHQDGGGSDDGDHHDGGDDHEGSDDGSNNCDPAAGEGEGEGEGAAPEVPPHG